MTSSHELLAAQNPDFTNRDERIRRKLKGAVALFGVGASLAIVACGGDDTAGSPTSSAATSTTSTGSAGSGGTGSSSVTSTTSAGGGGASSTPTTSAGTAGSTAAGSGGSSGGSGGSGGSTAAGSGGGGAGGGSGGSAGGAGKAGSGGTGGSGDGGTPMEGGTTEGGGGCITAPGKALQFNGTVVDLMTGDLGADLPGGDVARTIELWAKFTGAQSWRAEGSIMETGLAMGGGNKVLGLDLSGYTGTTAQFGPYTNGFSDNNNPNGVFVMNTPQMGWIHLAWSYSGNHGTFSFTVNGVQHMVITMAGMPTMAFTPGIVTLGASQTFGTQGWTGVMDNVRIWSVARTPAEVLRDMKVVLKGTETGLVADYRFSEGSGAFTDDVSMKASHRLSTCTATSMRCAAVNAAAPMWVDSDVPGPFTCAP